MTFKWCRKGSGERCALQAISDILDGGETVEPVPPFRVGNLVERGDVLPSGERRWGESLGDGIQSHRRRFLTGEILNTTEGRSYDGAELGGDGNGIRPGQGR